jgi:uncharacterized membrane protein YozB (DUF420 family)
LVRGIVEVAAEFLFEAVAAVIALALFAATVVAAVWGWRHSPVATIVLGAGLAAFLGLGVHELATRQAAHRRGGRLAATAAGAVVFVVGWVMYLLIYLPWPSS